MLTKRRIPFRPIAGGQDINEVLSTISGQLSALNGVNTPEANATREQLQREQAAAEAVKAAGAQTAAPVTGGLPNHDELVKHWQDSQTEKTAELVASSLAQQVRAQQQLQGEALSNAVAKALEKQMGTGGDNPLVQSAVAGVLAQLKAPGQSRYVNEHGNDDRVDELVAGGTGVSVRSPQSVQVGEVRGVKAIEDSKSLHTFMGAVMRFKQGLATEPEHAFLMKQHRKALAEGTGSAGGFLVPQEWMPDILGLLRAAAVVRRANPRIQPFSKQMNQTSISTGATAYYTAENARITPSEPTFAEVPLLTPKNLTGLVPVSTYLLWDAPGTDGAEDTVRSDLAEVIALREDLAFLSGTGTGGEPLGLKNQSGITSNPVAPGTNGVSLTMADTRRIKARFRSMNSGPVRPVWFFHPDFLGYLERLVDTTGRFLADTAMLQINDDNMSGRFDGVPFFCTTQIPNNITLGTGTTTWLMLVNMAETVVGVNRDLEITVSDEASYTPDGGTTWISAFQNNQTLFKAVMRHDIAHRRPAQIVVQNGVLY